MDYSTKLPAFILEAVKINDDGCWIWQRNLSNQGYARIGINRKNYKVARLVAEYIYGDSNGKFCLHSCDNPACVAPDHLRWGTPKENTNDMDQRNRRKSALGQANAKSKFTEEDIRFIRSVPINSSNKNLLASQFGVSPTAIRAVWLRKSWKWLD